LEALKEKLKADGVEYDAEIHDDLALRRFLGAHRQDLDKAYDAFVAMLVRSLT